MSKPDDVVDKPDTFEMRKYTSFVDMNIILMTITGHSYCRLIVEICVVHLRNFATLIY